MRESGLRDAGRGVAGLWGVLFAIWVAANASLDPVVLGLGAVLTGGIAGALTRAPTLWDDLRLGPRHVAAFLRYTVIFLRELVRSNLTMLRIVYAPRLDIRPGVVPTRTGLSTPMARFALANTVSLTPGSLVMGLQDQTLTVHMLNLETTDIDTNTAAVSGAFEPALGRAFG